MAVSVDYIYQLCLKLTKKNQAGGISSTDFAFHWNAAQKAYQDDLMGRFQPRAIGKIGMNTGLIENETILTKLTPFTKLSPALTVSSGQVIKPADFIYTLAIRANGEAVFQVNHDEWWSLKDEAIDPPSIADGSYYYTEYQNYYLVAPTATPTIDLDYISTPPDVLWAFSLDTNNRQVYNPSGSAQPLWDNNSASEITQRMLKTLGVAFASANFRSFGTEVQKDGE